MLSLYRTSDGGNTLELISFCETRFGTVYMMCERLMLVREHLQLLVVRDGWTNALKAPCVYRQKGLDVAAIVSDGEFWLLMRRSLAVMKPLFGHSS